MKVRHLSTQSPRELRIKVASAEMQTAQFDGREHLVFPVVMLVEGVIHAANADTPEFVPASAFGPPGAWDGRPVLWDHPVLNGQRVGAGIPIVLEQMEIGKIFNTRIEDRRLKSEVWLDVSRAEKSDMGRKVLERVRNGDTVEVSVGAFVATEPRSGAHEGKRFQGVWSEVVPDHLAMLPEGTEGACSVAMGCGAPRAAEAKRVTIKEKFLALLEKFRTAEDAPIGDGTVHSLLHQTLLATEPAFLGIVEVFSDAGQVVFATAPDGMEHLFRRSFKVDGAAVTLSDDREEVTMVHEFKPVQAAAAAPAPAAECGCNRAAEGKSDVNKIERLKAIIASGKTCFVEGDLAVLEGLADERIDAIEAHVRAASEAPAPATEPAPAAPVAETTTPAAVAAPLVEGLTDEELRKLGEQHLAARAAQRAERVKTLEGHFTADELKTLDDATLEKLAALAAAKPATEAPKQAAAVDQSGRAVPRPAGEDRKIDPPPSVFEAAAAYRQKQKETVAR